MGWYRALRVNEQTVSVFFCVSHCFSGGGVRRNVKLRSPLNVVSSTHSLSHTRILFKKNGDNVRERSGRRVSKGMNMCV